jgi:hypothetical protein
VGRVTVSKFSRGEEEGKTSGQDEQDEQDERT